MSDFKITLQGQGELLKKLNKMADRDTFLDPIILALSNKTIRKLVEGSQGKGNIRSGNTARNWRREKLAVGKYALINDAMTLDKKHLIVNILNYGHGEIRPKPENKRGTLRIPLTERGINRGVGYKNPGAVFGEDFIYAKKASATAGTKFMEKEMERATSELVDVVTQKIKELF